MSNLEEIKLNLFQINLYYFIRCSGLIYFLKKKPISILTEENLEKLKSSQK